MKTPCEVCQILIDQQDRKPSRYRKTCGAVCESRLRSKARGKQIYTADKLAEMVVEIRGQGARPKYLDEIQQRAEQAYKDYQEGILF